MRKHPTDRDGFDGTEGARCVSKLGDERDRGVVEVEQPSIPQLHDRGARERLGDRGDPVQGGRFGRPLRRHIREPDARPPHERLPVHDPHRGAGHPLLLDERSGLRLQLCGDVNHRAPHPRPFRPGPNPTVNQFPDR
jgi:hypothetical protein